LNPKLKKRMNWAMTALIGLISATAPALEQDLAAAA
jgi:hypothetical protein